MDDGKINGWTIVFADNSWTAQSGTLIGCTSSLRYLVENWARNHNPEDFRKQRKDKK